MKTNLLSSDKDPMGTAIADYFHHNKADKLRVFSSQFEEDEIPVNQLFRPYDEMPELEQIALQMAEGNTLDVGAGSGCHALALQEMGKEVCAIDISPRSVEVMEKRGVLQPPGRNQQGAPQRLDPAVHRGLQDRQRNHLQLREEQRALRADRLHPRRRPDA